jgi:hypothetical protein
LDSGAWGSAYYDFIDSGRAPIPNNNIYIYNNIFYNSNDSATLLSHFSIAGQVTKIPFNATCPRPSNADDDLVIRGNIIWNGKPDKELGISASSGCGTSNPTCNQSQLERENLINAAEPKFVNADIGNFHPKPGSVVFTVAKIFPVPDFSWAGLPANPKEPTGNISNSVPVDRDSIHRNPSYPICGAFVISISSVNDQPSPNNEIALFQNFPNPSKEETTIEYQLLHGSHVSLDVFNLLGEKVGSLVSSYNDEGDHSIELSTKGLAPGKYFYRLSTGSMTETKQMTIVR